jgi:hypothetical protein
MAGDTRNEKHQRDAERRARRRLNAFTDAVRAVMSTPAGRLMMGDPTYGILSRCKLDTCIFEASAKIYFNSGMQNVGLEIKALLAEVDEDALILMQNEMRLLAKREKNEAEASVTDSVSERG